MLYFLTVPELLVASELRDIALKILRLMLVPCDFSVSSEKCKFGSHKVNIHTSMHTKFTSSFFLTVIFLQNSPSYVF